MMLGIADRLIAFDQIDLLASIFHRRAADNRCPAQPVNCRSRRQNSLIKN